MSQLVSRSRKDPNGLKLPDDDDSGLEEQFARPVMSSTTRHEKILSLIEAALPLLQTEITKAENGLEAVDSLLSLKFIKARLEDMEQMIRSGSVQKDERYKGSMRRLAVDTWPSNDPLGSKITEIEYEFYRLK